MNILSDEEFDRHMERLIERAGMSQADASVSDLAASFQRLSSSLASFSDAVAVATEEWPELIFEDVLDAEYISD